MTVENKELKSCTYVVAFNYPICNYDRIQLWDTCYCWVLLNPMLIQKSVQNADSFSEVLNTALRPE